jgi:high-affinity iron transporter
MQGTGWIPITPLDVELPYWPGVWLGVYPTWETIGAQIGAMVFVIGSYVAAQEIRVKRPQRKARRRGEDVTAEPAAAEDAQEELTAAR